MAKEKQDQSQEKPELKKCFVVMPIADMDGYDKGHFSRVYKHLIIPACKKAGYDAIRADDTETSHYIVVDIMRKIVNSDMVICDLSGRNPNVMFELGFRQAFNLPTVLIKDEKTPNIFDIQGIRHTTYDQSLRIDNVQEKIEKIAQSITSTANASTESADITSLVQMLSLQPATIPNQVQLSQDSSVLLNAINDIGSRLSKLETNSNNSITLSRPFIIDGHLFKKGDYIYDISKTPTLTLGKFDGIDKYGVRIIDSRGNIAYLDEAAISNGDISYAPF